MFGANATLPAEPAASWSLRCLAGTVFDPVQRFTTLSAKYDDAGMLIRWICPYVGEVEIECDEYPDFVSHPGCNGGVHRHRTASRPTLLRHRPPLSEHNRGFDGKILVYLEFHALRSKGRSMLPSRASSAAYERAASISFGFNAG